MTGCVSPKYFSAFKEVPLELRGEQSLAGVEIGQQADASAFLG